MTRTLLLATVLLVAAAAVAIGSYTALAGSDPVSDVAGAVIGDDGPDVDESGTDDASDVEDDVAAEDVEDDGDGEAVSEDTDESDEAVVQADGETGEGAEKVAQAIADAFGAQQADVLALHEQGIGFGALFKLYQLSQATGVGVPELLASFGEEGYAFGKRFKELTDEQRALIEDGPKNLGQLVSAANHPDEDGEAGVTETTAPQAHGKAKGKFASNSSNGHGPPDGVPAHGHN